MSKINDNSSQKVFLWLMAATLLILAGFVIYAAWGGGNGSGEISDIEPITDKDQIKGNRSAQNILIEYSDFQCPACAAFYPVVKELAGKYGATTVIAYRHFPLPQHKNAELAAKASEAAALQGGFWEMHDAIFESQKDWSDLGAGEAEKFFLSLAEKINLETKRFSEDMESEPVKDKVEKDRLSGVRAKVNATPTFFLNGQKLNINGFDDLEIKIKEAAEATGERSE